MSDRLTSDSSDIEDPSGEPGGDASEDSCSDQLTLILQDAGNGSNTAQEALLSLVYDELRSMAQVRMQNERSDHTLQATALVHEAFVRLSGGRPVTWENRAHFFGAAARAMQCILVDHARMRGRIKRPESRRRAPLSVVDLAIEADLEQVQAVQDAIDGLAEQDERMAQLVRLRFYAGLSVLETAKVLGISDRTVRREWALARAWLARELDV